MIGLRPARRLEIPFGGASRSGLPIAVWRALPRFDWRLSFGGRAGRWPRELPEWIESFSIGGGGVDDPGESTALFSGS